MAIEPVLLQRFLGELRQVVAPFLLVVLSGDGPSGLIAIDSPSLPLLDAFFPASLHQYFKPK